MMGNRNEVIMTKSKRRMAKRKAKQNDYGMKKN